MANILGDIDPVSPRRPASERDRERDDMEMDPKAEVDESMVGGSQHDRVKHPGSREVTEGTTGGTGTEVGGTRNFRTGTGATGSDIGNRPE